MTDELKNTPKAEREAAKAARARLELGKKMAFEMGEVPFDVEGDEKKFEDKAKVLASTKDANEAELSFILYVLRNGKGYLDKHYSSFDDYVEAEIKIGRSKASTLVQAWGHFMDLGLPVSILGGPSRISWSKFRLLKPAIKTGQINSESIYEWLPYIAAAGPESLRDKDLENRVRRLAGLAEKEASEKDYVVVKMHVPKDKVDAVQSYHDVIAQATGLEEQSSHYIMAMENMFARITANEQEAARAAGLANLKKAAEAIVPGLTVVFVAPDAPEYSYDSLGIAAAHYVYQGIKEVDGKREFQFVLASSDEDAEELVGKTTRKYPVLVSNAIKVQVAAPRITEKKVETVEEKVVSEPVEANPQSITARWRNLDLDLVDSATKASIIKEVAKKLVQEKIISEEGYTQKINEFKAEIPNSKLCLNAIIRWLFDVAAEANV